MVTAILASFVALVALLAWGADDGPPEAWA